jgi:hypothetical protein
MGKMMASGEAVPLSVLEGVTPNQAETLAEKGIEDVEALAATTVDDLVEYLDVSLDEAETILSSAKAIVEARNQEIEPSVEGDAEAGSGEAGDETPVESTDESGSEASATEPAEATDASVEADHGAEAEATEVEATETETAETDATETEASETEAAEVEAETSEASDEDGGEETEASKQ